MLLLKCSLKGVASALPTTISSIPYNPNESSLKKTLKHAADSTWGLKIRLVKPLLFKGNVTEEPVIFGIILTMIYVSISK